MNRPDDDQFRRTLALRGVASGDVDDLVQKIRIRLWQKAPLVDAAHNPAAYEVGVAKDAANAYQRQARVRAEDLMAVFDDVPCSGFPDPEAQASAREEYRIVAGFVDEIGESFRGAFIARVFYDDSIAEIAAADGVLENTVKKRLRLAQRDFDAAWARWQAKQRWREGGRLFRVRGLFDIASAARALNARLHRWLLAFQQTALPVAGCLLLGAFAPSSPAITNVASVVPPAIASGGLPSTALLGASSSIDTSPERFVAEPGRAEADAPPTDTAKGSSPNAGRTQSQIEEMLVGGARTALKKGTPGANARALRLLMVHRARFPTGRLAAEREALLQKLL